MKKRYIVGILSALLFPFLAEGTHKYGAQITATVKSCQANIYTITITSYEDLGTETGFGGGILELGFGDPIDINDEIDFSREVGSYGDDSLSISRLVLDDVAFPSSGEYIITFTEFNRNANVVNIRNSVNTPLYVEAKLVIDPFLCNSTPQLSGVGNYRAYVNSAFAQELSIYDPDGDSLSLELIVPKQELGVPVAYLGAPLDVNLRYADNPTNAEGTGLPTFAFDTSALVWNAPNLPGDFVVALRVNEWREINGEWQQLGYVTRDLTIQVLDTVNNISFTDIITSTPEEELHKPEVRLFPNPNEGEFTLEITGDIWRAATATLHNIIGQEINRRTVLPGENSYSIPECQPGVYFLTLRQGALQNVLRFVKR
ncbi:T9SS type A sorting domain-containing protein [Tunicatimonas pelagia]|uniref:T9SS type A sorting domain-containing protein n=1 Tax=Tunicatimonas pelagia TaxID=931531 RepID=UPI0026652EA8|nr:T9SS type A sorting domain-containing protein [Tunicatimonas pelagia]WKN43908.1 T9SS type A sorting domain-containing protein [Tunicatimonas pelagia]